MKNNYTLDALCPVDYINASALADNTPKRVVFLDRDGTIHIDKRKTHRLEDLEYFADSFTALKALADLGYRLVIVTNQQGIGEGLFGVDAMHAFNTQIMTDMEAHGVYFDAIYYAPHAPTENHISYKPNCGMLWRAERELNVDMAHSFMIGDKVSDVQAAINAGVRGIMVTTGIYKNDDYRTEEYLALAPTTVSNLTEAVEIIRQEAK